MFLVHLCHSLVVYVPCTMFRSGCVFSCCWLSRGCFTWVFNAFLSYGGLNIPLLQYYMGLISEKLTGLVPDVLVSVSQIGAFVTDTSVSYIVAQFCVVKGGYSHLYWRKLRYRGFALCAKLSPLSCVF